MLLQLFPEAEEDHPLRRRRDLNPDDAAHFREELGEMKGDLTAKMSNLTCVMRRMNYLDEDNMVNMDFLLNGKWEEVRTRRSRRNITQVPTKPFTISEPQNQLIHTFGQHIKMHPSSDGEAQNSLYVFVQVKEAQNLTEMMLFRNVDQRISKL